MPLECLGRVVFGPGMSRYTGPAGPADPDDAADPQGAVQTLTPPALR